MQLLADNMAESLKSPRQLQRSLRDDNIYKLFGKQFGKMFLMNFEGGNIAQFQSFKGTMDDFFSDKSNVAEGMW